MHLAASSGLRLSPIGNSHQPAENSRCAIVIFERERPGARDLVRFNRLANLDAAGDLSGAACGLWLLWPGDDRTRLVGGGAYQLDDHEARLRPVGGAIFSFISSYLIRGGARGLAGVWVTRFCWPIWWGARDGQRLRGLHRWLAVTRGRGAYLCASIRAERSGPDRRPGPRSTRGVIFYCYAITHISLEVRLRFLNRIYLLIHVALSSTKVVEQAIKGFAVVSRLLPVLETPHMSMLA